MLVAVEVDAVLDPPDFQQVVPDPVRAVVTTPRFPIDSLTSIAHRAPLPDGSGPIRTLYRPEALSASSSELLATSSSSVAGASAPGRPAPWFELSAEPEQLAKVSTRATTAIPIPVRMKTSPCPGVYIQDDVSGSACVRWGPKGWAKARGGFRLTRHRFVPVPRQLHDIDAEAQPAVTARDRVLADPRLALCPALTSGPVAGSRRRAQTLGVRLPRKPALRQGKGPGLIQLPGDTGAATRAAQRPTKHWEPMFFGRPTDRWCRRFQVLLPQHFLNRVEGMVVMAGRMSVARSGSGGFCGWGRHFGDRAAAGTLGRDDPAGCRVDRWCPPEGATNGRRISCRWLSAQESSLRDDDGRRPYGQWCQLRRTSGKPARRDVTPWCTSGQHGHHESAR